VTEREPDNAVMKKFLLAGVAMVGIMLGQALAADLSPRPVPAPIAKAPAFVPAFSWTGCYLGVQGGYSWANTGYDLDIPPTPNSGIDFKLRGGVAGGHAGCNYQFNSFVLGIEGDGEWNGLRGNDGGLGGTIDTITGKWDASIRGRFGFAIDRVLFYGTAGAAWLNVDYSRPNFDPLVINNTLTGWTAGAGIEYAFAQNWTGRVEYRFARFGSEGFPFTTGTQRTLRETETNTVRAGISYKFGGGF
jgi:outer membrane immunogenic protein